MADADCSQVKLARDNMKNILKRYLNTLVYIDDKFGLSLIGEEPQDNPTPPSRRTRKIITAEQSSSMENFETEPAGLVEKDQLSLLIEKMQRKYPQIKMLPVKYTDQDDRPYIKERVKSSKLVVVDWQLSEVKERDTEVKYTAADVLKSALESSDKMRLLVIYTSDPDGAEMDFEAKGILSKFNSKTINRKSFKYTLKENSIVLICKKIDFCVEDLIEVYADLILENFGFFPVAFLDMLLKLDDKVGSLLKKFSQPFDSILLMQIENSGVEYTDNGEIIRKLVTNSFYDEIQCDPCIVENLYYSRIGRLKELCTEPPEALTERINRATDILLARCASDDKKILKLLKKISPSELITWLQAIDSSPDKWACSLALISNNIINRIAFLRAEEIGGELWELVDFIPKDKGKICNIPIAKEKIDTEILKSVKLQVQGVLKSTTSLFLLLISDTCTGPALSQLIANLKLGYYVNPDDIASIIGGIQVDEKSEIKPETMKNKFFSGDILYKKTETNKYEFLMCIVPSCQIFRPHKIDYVISFISGEKQLVYTEDAKKDSEHITIIPHPEIPDKLISVKWKFHDIIRFDLKTDDKEKLAQYRRQYRLADDYYRQLSSEFNGFYSKIGVDDLFIKQSPVLANFFLK